MKNGRVLPPVSKRAEKVYYEALPALDVKRRAKSKAANAKSIKPPRSPSGSREKMERECAATAELARLLR